MKEKRKNGRKTHWPWTWQVSKAAELGRAKEQSENAATCLVEIVTWRFQPDKLMRDRGSRPWVPQVLDLKVTEEQSRSPTA